MRQVAAGMAMKSRNHAKNPGEAEQTSAHSQLFKPNRAADRLLNSAIRVNHGRNCSSPKLISFGSAKWIALSRPFALR